MALTRSMSKPSRRLPSAVWLRYPQRKLFWSTPATSLPAALIRAMVAPSTSEGRRLASGSWQVSVRVQGVAGAAAIEAGRWTAGLPVSGVAWASGSRTTATVVAQATAIALTPPQPRSRRAARRKPDAGPALAACRARPARPVRPSGPA